MSDDLSDIPSAAHYLPDWTERRFIVVERTGRWAPAISAEVNSHVKQGSSVLTFEACLTTRDAVDFIDLKNTLAFLLFLDGQERDCLAFLGRLGRSYRHHEILAVVTNVHRNLLPVIMEAGVQSVLTDVRDDIDVAEWCCRVAEQRLTNSPG